MGISEASVKPSSKKRRPAKAVSRAIAGRIVAVGWLGEGAVVVFAAVLVLCLGGFGLCWCCGVFVCVLFAFVCNCWFVFVLLLVLCFVWS